MYWYKIVYFGVQLIKRFLHISGEHIPIYCHLLFVTSVIMCVQTCVTYQIKGEILVFVNIIVLNCLSSWKIITRILFLIRLFLFHLQHHNACRRGGTGGRCGSGGVWEILPYCGNTRRDGKSKR